MDVDWPVDWSRIMDQDVRPLPPGKFSHKDLSWDYYVYKGSKLYSSWIEADRLGDFIEGEKSRESFPTSFRISHKKKTPLKSDRNPRINTSLEYTMYE
jgi:hypothetical protein